MRSLLNASMCLCLLPLIAACATTEVRTTRIPESLLASCDKPAWGGKSYRDVAELAVRRGKAIDDCNDQLSAAREYQRRIAK